MTGRRYSDFVSKEPWYKKPPHVGADPLTVEWGYLYAYSNGRCEFTQDEIPSMEEITNSNTYKALIARQLYDSADGASQQ